MNRTALITGAGRGLGLAIAERLLAPGLTLGLNVRRASAGVSALADKARAIGASVEPLVFDVADAAETTHVVEAFLERHPVDILINNAGVTHDTLAVRLSEADLERVLGVDFVAAARLSRLCMRGMVKRRHGRVVQISSIVAKKGNVGQAAYAAAKAALEAYTRSAAKELGSRGVTLNCVAPGFIDTDMTRGLKEDWKQKILQEIPLRRFGTVADVAEVVAFLCAEESSYVTGQVVDVAGGLLA